MTEGAADVTTMGQDQEYSADAPTDRGGLPPGIPPREPVLVLSEPRHWEALSSPSRFEILEQMRSAAPCSVAELARQMDRPADGLYHHLRKLLKVGLIREVAQRRAGKQVESVYDLVYDTMHFEIDPRTGRNVEEMRKLAGALLRLSGRVFDAGIASSSMNTRGPLQNVWGRLDTSWLTAEELARLNRHLQAIHDLLVEGNRKREGQLITLGIFGGPALRPRRADTPAPAGEEEE